MELYFGCGWFGQKGMSLKFRKRYLIGALILGYQIFFDFNGSTTLDWFYSISEWFGIDKPWESYEGPVAWVGFLILHRAVIHTFVVYCWTGNRSFTHLYGIIEVLLIVGMISMFVLKIFVGDWVFFSFSIFHTFLDLLKSPLLLIIFLPSYFIIKQIQEPVESPKK